MASQGSSTMASSASTAGALAAPASPSKMAQASSPVMALGDAAMTSSSPTGYRPFSTRRLSVLAKPFYPTTGSSSSMAAMAGPPESLSAMASMPSGTAASSSSATADATFGQVRVQDPPMWTKASSFFTTDTSGPPAMPSVWAMGENPVLLGNAGLGEEKLEGAWPGLLAFELGILGVPEVKEPGMGLDGPTRDHSQQPMGAGQDEPGNGKQPPGAGQDQQPKGAAQYQQPMGAGQDQLGNGKQPMGREQAQVGRLPMIKFGSFDPTEIP